MMFQLKYQSTQPQNETIIMIVVFNTNSFVAYNSFKQVIGKQHKSLFQIIKIKWQRIQLKLRIIVKQDLKLQQMKSLSQTFDLLDFLENQTKPQVKQENNIQMTKQTLKDKTLQSSKERIITSATSYQKYLKIKTLQINTFQMNKKLETLALSKQILMSAVEAYPSLKMLFDDLKRQEISSKLQQLIVSKHKEKMFFSNPYAVWTPTVSPYHCYCLTPSLPNQNYILQDIIPYFPEQIIFQSAKTYFGQTLIQKQNNEHKSEQVLENSQMQSPKIINHSILENSKKMKKTMQNHNVLPNIMNTMLSYIRRRNKTGRITQKIINKQKNKESISNLTTSKYYAYQIYLHSKIPKSKHQSSLRFIVNHLDPSLDAFSVQEQIFYNRVCRILILELLNQEFLLTFLTTRKCAKTSQSDHMKARRFIIALLKQGLDFSGFSNLQ